MNNFKYSKCFCHHFYSGFMCQCCRVHNSNSQIVIIVRRRLSSRCPAYPNGMASLCDIIILLNQCLILTMSPFRLLCSRIWLRRSRTWTQLYRPRDALRGCRSANLHFAPAELFNGWVPGQRHRYRSQVTVKFYKTYCLTVFIYICSP